MELNFFGLVFLLFFRLIWAFEENTHFCIRTSPVLLADLEKRLIPTAAGDTNCEVLATTLTVKEKEILHKTLCKDYGSSHKENYYFFQLHNGGLKARPNHLEICAGKRNPLLAWVPYEMVLHHYANELDPKERVSYIAKATDVEREKTELCHFSHADLATNIAPDLFSCVVLVFEDNFYGLDANINVLIEIQPLMYELRNVTYLPWVNVTTSYKTQLGHTSLKNHNPERRRIYGSVQYAFVEKVQVNASSVYGEKLPKLPILFEHKGAVLELDNAGTGGLDVKERAYFGRVMDPKTNVNVQLIGQWAERHQQFTADIYEYFGAGIRRFRQEMSGGEASFVRIQQTEPIYELPESTHLANITVHKMSAQHRFQRLTDGTNATIDADSTTDDSLDYDAEEFAHVAPEGGHPYPGFYPWSVIGGLIVGVVLLAAVIGMVRTCSKEENKHNYKVATGC